MLVSCHTFSIAITILYVLGDLAFDICIHSKCWKDMVELTCLQRRILDKITIHISVVLYLYNLS